VLREHLDAHGFATVTVELWKSMVRATRADPDNPWVRFALSSLERTAGSAPALLPNLGGSLPNAAFAGTLGLPTVWIPHSYPACAQHAPDEHLLAPLAREALGLMAGLFWDLGGGLRLGGADGRRCHIVGDLVVDEVREQVAGDRGAEQQDGR
jgi:hypothetical protein